jgi:hypothetical protein
MSQKRRNRLRRKHLRTLKAIFNNPTLKNIKWEDVESLFIALGGETQPGRGSRLRAIINARRAVFHRPHPGNEVNVAMVKSIRRFLIEADLDPDDYDEISDAEDEDG